MVPDEVASAIVDYVVVVNNDVLVPIMPLMLMSESQSMKDLMRDCRLVVAFASQKNGLVTPNPTHP